jgi:hypothetical protein
VKRKLQLGKHTVRRLATAELAQVGGATAYYYAGAVNPAYVYAPGPNPFTALYSWYGVQCGIRNDSKDGGSGI